MISPITSAIYKILDAVGRDKIAPSDSGKFRSINLMVRSSKVKGNRILPATMEKTRAGGGYSAQGLGLGSKR